MHPEGPFDTSRFRFVFERVTFVLQEMFQILFNKLLLLFSCSLLDIIVHEHDFFQQLTLQSWMLNQTMLM